MNNDLTIWTKYGGTKFIVVILCLLWAITLSLRPDLKVDPKLYDFVVWIVGIFYGANVGVIGVQTLASKAAAVASSPTSESKP